MKQLKDLTDNQLILNIRKKFCDKSMTELINRHEKLYFSTVHKYHRKHLESSLQDLLDDLYLVFNNTVQKFDIKKKTKFSTYLSYSTFWHCLNSNKHYGKTCNMEHKDIDFINESNNKYQSFECSVQETNKYAMEMLNKLEDKRIKEIFKLRYIVGGKGNKIASWKQIAPKLGISISYCITLHQKGLKFLNAKMKSNVICDEI